MIAQSVGSGQPAPVIETKLDPQACRNLLAAVLHQAKRDCERQKEDAYFWAKGTRAALFTDYLGLDNQRWIERIEEIWGQNNNSTTTTTTPQPDYSKQQRRQKRPAMG